MNILRILLAILLPPVGVFLTVGLGLQFWLNILLTSPASSTPCGSSRAAPRSASCATGVRTTSSSAADSPRGVKGVSFSVDVTSSLPPRDLPGG
jgi:hypothetical protein